MTKFTVVLAVIALSSSVAEAKGKGYTFHTYDVEPTATACDINDTPCVMQQSFRLRRSEHCKQAMFFGNIVGAVGRNEYEARWFDGLQYVSFIIKTKEASFNGPARTSFCLEKKMRFKKYRLTNGFVAKVAVFTEDVTGTHAIW